MSPYGDPRFPGPDWQSISLRPMGRFEMRLREWAGRDWRWALWLLNVLERTVWKP